MDRRAHTAIVALALWVAACCPAPSTSLPAPLAAEARVEVVTDAAPAGFASARSGRTRADGTALHLEPADDLVLAPNARLYLVGHWLDDDRLYVASAHPVP